MGYRSTLVSQDYYGKLPDWFKEKYGGWILFPNGLTVSSKHEAKYYDNQFFEDYQKAVIESGFWDDMYTDIDIVIVVLAEDGFITKVTITKKEIRYTWMEDGIDSGRVWCNG
tara:strand:- start:39 stop:374 length:336 start_codon:yes stop_codon:yes gene_type:complete